MSELATGWRPEELPPPICQYCGCKIAEGMQDCVALDDGVCAP